MKLKALGFQYISGTLYKTADSAYFSSQYGSGITISEVYWQEKTGVIGGIRIGVEDNVWIPFSAITGGVKIEENDKLVLVIDGITKTFQVMTVKKEIYSDYEDHYELNIEAFITS